MPPRQPRHWGGNQGAHWRNKTINGINCSTYDMPHADQLRPTLDVTVVTEVIVRRYSLQPLDLPPKPGAKARLWRKP
jgi:hypothetical protein